MSLARIIIHWTAGGGRASDIDRQHYHLLVEHDGTIVAGKEDPADNIVTSDGDYAAHTRNLNTGSIGVALCGMRGAQEHPFQAGAAPLTEYQVDAACALIAELCRTYSIPVTPRTVLTHAEVQPTLGVTQRGKWDITRLPHRPDVVGAIPVGNLLRDKVRLHLGAAPVATGHNLPVLSIGAGQRATVRILQQDLAALGYHIGRIEGVFGKRTRAAVLAFQADHGLVADGIVGPDTWAAFDRAEARDDRSVTATDLRRAGSRTMELADKAEAGAKGLQGATGTALTVGGAVELAKSAQQAEGALEVAQRLLVTYWPVLLVGGLVWIGARYGRKIAREIRDIRVEDARSGAHMGR